MATADRPRMPPTLTHGVSLTPVRKRRARISYSPAKNTPQHQNSLGCIPKSHSSTFPESRPKEVDVQYHLSTSALEFEEFSFRGDDGSLRRGNVTEDQLKAIHSYLWEHFGACDFFYQEPIVLIGCEADRLPPEDERPFTVAGLVAIWRTLEEPIFSWFVGSFGDGPDIKIDPEMLAKIDLPNPVPDEVIIYLATYIFPDCEAITTLWSAMIVELPLMSQEDHRARIETLPRDFEDGYVILRYYNGPLPNSERRRERIIQPQPKYIDGACDETDYVALENTFYPGTMLSSVNAKGEPICSVTAGILVEKGAERRLTCSFHNWEKHYNKYPDKFGQTDEKSRDIFKVIQGTNPGTDIGFVRERIGDTNIALAQLHDNIAFDNNFMEINCTPKVFLRGQDQDMGDQYLIDSFMTGKQRLFGFGERFAVGRRGREPRHDVRIPDGMEHLRPSPNVAYIMIEQKVCTINTPIMHTKPYIRDGVCGAVLLRIRDKSKTPEKDVMARGEIGGMMHFADLQIVHASQAESYFVYADVFDPLMNQGWTIAQSSPSEPHQVPPRQEASQLHEQKRKDRGSGNDGGDNESPTKRRKA